VDELIVAARAVHFAALALLLGAPSFRLAVSPHGPATGWPGGRRIELAAAAMVLVSALGWFAGVAASMAGSWTDALAPDMLRVVAFDTRFGRLWIARLAAMVATLAFAAWPRPTLGKDVALVLLASAIAASLVGTGHGTAGEGTLGPFHAVADVIHLLCAMGWVGGLVCLAQVLRRATRGSITGEDLRLVLRRFSHIGYWLVTLLLISGCVNALVLVRRPDSLITSAYGRVLLVKLVLVLIMVALAAYNRVVLTARVSPTTGGRALWRSVVAEQGVGLLVLATVAALGTVHPVP
jgi:copper resistance protein D